MARQGLPASYIKKYGVSKRAWREYRKKQGKSNKSRSPRRRVGTKPMARRRRRRTYTRRRSRKKRTIPVLPLIGVGVPIVSAIQEGRSYGGDIPEQIKNIGNAISLRFTGYNAMTGQFESNRLMEGWGPVIVGILGHKIAGMLGVNRIFSNLPSPLNKLRL